MDQHPLTVLQRELVGVTVLNDGDDPSIVHLHHVLDTLAAACRFFDQIARTCADKAPDDAGRDAGALPTRHDGPGRRTDRGTGQNARIAVFAAAHLDDSG